jgi:hypothetical protein
MYISYVLMGRKNNVIQNIDVVDQVKNHPFRSYINFAPRYIRKRKILRIEEYYDNIVN